MIPTWAAVVTALSLAIMAVSVVVVAVSSAVAALGMRAFLRAVEHLAGPAVDDVRQLVAFVQGDYREG